MSTDNMGVNGAGLLTVTAPEPGLVNRRPNRGGITIHHFAHAALYIVKKTCLVALGILVGLALLEAGLVMAPISAVIATGACGGLIVGMFIDMYQNAPRAVEVKQVKADAKRKKQRPMLGTNLETQQLKEDMNKLNEIKKDIRSTESLIEMNNTLLGRFAQKENKNMQDFNDETRFIKKVKELEATLSRLQTELKEVEARIKLS